MTSSKGMIGCAVIVLLFCWSASGLTLSSHEQVYKAEDFVKGHTQILNACYKALPQDKVTTFEWLKGPANKLIITSCSNEPAKIIKRDCSYTIGAVLGTDGTAFTLGACTIIQQGSGCVDPVPNYITRLASVTILELLSDRFNFRVKEKGNIQLVTQNKP